MDRRTALKTITAAGVSSLLQGCEPETAASAPDAGNNSNLPMPTSLGGRVLGIVATEPAAGDFGTDVIARIQRAGGTSTSLSVYWDHIETAPGVYAPDPNYLAIAELFYPPFGISITHSFSVIDTTNKRLPADIADRSFDDPVVIDRFNAMLDWAATQVPNVDLQVLSIGNEVDIYLNAHPDEWPAWQTFFARTAAHARTLWPNAVIGCKATWSGLRTEPSRTQMNQLHSHADAVLATYYAIDDQFGIVNPATMPDVFAELITLAGELPVRILEHGCPSDPLLGSSERIQAEFITATFQAWDSYADRIPHIEIFALHDFDPAVVGELQTYYSFSDDRFAAYLGSLGVRTHAGAGTDKLAWQRLLDEVAARS